MSPMTTNRRFWACLLALGISSVSVQLIMAREIMSTFSGNELILGVVLGAWLLFTGLGSALGARRAGSRRPDALLFWGHLVVAVWPFCQILIVRALPLFWVRGEIQGLPVALVSGSLTFLPYCLTAGAMIPLAGAFLSGKDTPSRVYVADTIGDILGGLLFSLILVYLFPHWTSLILLAVLNLFAAAAMQRGPLRFIPVVLCGLVVAASPSLDTRSLSWRFPGQEIVLHKGTPFGQLTITRSGRQINVFQDAIPTFSTHDLHMEATAHLPLCQVPQGARVLLIAGGVFGTLDEMAKHAPERIDYVELDPAILALSVPLGRAPLPERVRSHVGDGRLFVKQTSATYDLVIVDLPDPENAQLNRFYTKEFFREVKAVLSPGGVLAFSLVGAENYMEETGLALNRSVFSALRQAFDHLLVLPGPTHHFMASDRPLTRDVEEVLASRGITTQRLVDYDLAAMTDPWRIDKLSELLAGKEVFPNSDLSPRAFGHLLDMWLKKTWSPRGILYLVFLLIIVSAVLSTRGNRIYLAIMTSGYAAMAFELTLILLFQVLYGYAYLAMCMLITLFMIGSVLGALGSRRWERSLRDQIRGADLVLVFLAVATAAVAVLGVRSLEPAVLSAIQYLIIPLLIFVAAAATGCQFSAASRACGGEEIRITGRLYGADLAGAACGTILTGLFFIPSMGIIGVLVSIVVLKGISLLLTGKAGLVG